MRLVVNIEQRFSKPGMGPSPLLLEVLVLLLVLLLALLVLLSSPSEFKESKVLTVNGQGNYLQTLHFVHARQVLSIWRSHT